MSEKRETNYVIVVDYVEGQYLDDAFLLDWNDDDDWYSTDIDGSDLITADGKIIQNNRGLIEIDRDNSCYVGEKLTDCEEYSDGANSEGYDCTICRIEPTENGWLLVPETT